MRLWVVWENNSTQPHIFHSEEAAFEYRRERVTQVRHQVYIAHILTEGESNVE